MLPGALLLDCCQKRVQFQRNDAFQFVGKNLSNCGDSFVLSKYKPMSALDRSNRWLGNSRSPHADQINRANFRIVASAGQHKRGNVCRNPTPATNESQLADRGKVMDDAVSGNDRSVVDVNVPAEQHSVDKKRMVKDVTVVGNMRVGHQHVSVANARPVIFLFGASTDGDSLTKEIVIADFDSSVSVNAEADILRLATDHTVWPEAVPLANENFAQDDHVTVKLRAVADRNVWADDTEGANFDIVTNSGGLMHV